MLSGSMGAIRRVTRHPAMNFFIGVIFMVTGGVEIWRGLGADLTAATIGAHHGVFLFGLLNVLKNIPDLFEGLKYVQRPGGDD